MSRTAIGAYPSTPRTVGGKKLRLCRGATRLLRHAAGAGMVASSFIGFVRANVLIAQRASLDNWLGYGGFLRQPDKSTFSRGLGGYEGKLFRYQFFAERSFRCYS